VIEDRHPGDFAFRHGSVWRTEESPLGYSVYSHCSISARSVYVSLNVWTLTSSRFGDSIVGYAVESGTMLTHLL